MADDSLDDFAKRLIETVRDTAITQCDLLVGESTGGGALGDRWRALLQAPADRKVMHALLPDVVDTVLFHLLDAIDNDLLPLALMDDDGTARPLSQLGQGEMGGWLMMGAGGWIERYSHQRYFDSLAGLGED